MKHEQNCRTTRRGFTIVELLVVMSVMAVIATLAIGAAIKSVKQSRLQRINTMARTLEMALSSYRAQNNEWPFTVGDLTPDPRDKNIMWAHGQDNIKVFRKLYQGSGSSIVYLDASAFLTTVNGARMPLRKALSEHKLDAPLGYPQPDNMNRFCYYCVCYFPLTDTVKVYRQDQQHPEIVEAGEKLDCPNWTKP